MSRAVARARRQIVLPVLLAVVATAILVALGTWQVQRLEWKRDLIARVEARVDAPPVAAPGPATWAGFEMVDWEYRPVTVSGEFGAEELHLYFPLTSPRGPIGGPGYMVIAPFTTDAGWTVLVNRGFVPEDRKDPASRIVPAGADGGRRMTLTGLVRAPEEPTFVTPDPDLEDNIWFARDRTGMIAALDLDPRTTAPYMLDLTADMTPESGIPQAGETRIAFSNNHLQYALTWYGLAVTCVAVTALFVRRKLKAAADEDRGSRLAGI